MTSSNATTEETDLDSPPVQWLRLLREYWSLATILLAQLPMLLLHFRDLWRQPQYRYFLVVLPVIGYLIFSRIERMPRGFTGVKRRVYVYAMLAASLSLLTLGSVAVFSPWLAAIAWVLAFGSALLLLTERYFIANSVGIWVLSWLLVPLPSPYDLQAADASQRLTASISGNLLERLGIINLVEGTTLSLAHGDLFVDQACGAVVSPMSIIASALIVAVWNNRAAVHTILLVAGGLVWGLTTNVLRMVTLAVSQEWIGLDLAVGWKHDLLGLCLFVVAFLLVLSTDRLLTGLLAPLRRDRYGISVQPSVLSQSWDSIMAFGRPVQDVTQWATICDDTHLHRSRRFPTVILAVWAGLFCVAGITSAVLAFQNMAGTDRIAPESVARPDATSLPDSG